jgi:hypothetical protein
MAAAHIKLYWGTHTHKTKKSPSVLAARSDLGIHSLRVEFNPGIQQSWNPTTSAGGWGLGALFLILPTQLSNLQTVEGTSAETETA